jgi:signal transduction histidine kinase
MTTSILIADDLRANLLALEATLQPLGQRVVSARSGAEALALAEAEEFAVALMDVQMPVLDGFETVAMIRRHPRNKALPVIFITAFHNEREFMARGYDLGAVDYITKPFDPDFLRAKVAFFVELYQRGKLLEEQAARLREKDRLAAEQLASRQAAELASQAKDDFLAMVSHELRTPLTAIVGWVELLQAGRLDAPAQVRALEAIRRCGHAQSQLIDELLDVSRIVNGSFTIERAPIDLREVVSEAAETLRAAARDKQVGIELMGADEPLIIDGDGQRLQQVVWNLVDNALKFSRPQGAVEVRARKNAASAELVVRDQGHGIDAAFLPHVFERFKQGAGLHRTGLGLGLAIAKHIVEQHHGTIRAESAGRGQGATFTVTLPLTR